MPLSYTDPEGKTWTLGFPIHRVHEIFLSGRRVEDGRLVTLHHTIVKGFMPNIPFQKSERSFRRFEKFLGTAVAVLPDKPAALDPRPLAATTCVARLRDAINSLMEYEWETYVDIQKLRKIRPQIEVIIVNNMVVIQSKGSGKLPRVTETEVPAEPTSYGLRLKEPSPAVLEAVATLHGARVIALPTFVQNVSREVLNDLAARHDIAISEEVDGFVIF